MTDAELKARPGSGADSGISKYSGSGVSAAQKSYNASKAESELEKKGEEYWNGYVRRLHRIRLGQIDRALHKEAGESLEQVKDVYIEAYKRRQDQKEAWDDTNKFMTAYLSGDGDTFSYKSTNPVLLQDIGREKGLVAAYNMWSQVKDGGNALPKEAGSAGINAQAASRPGSMADKGIGSDTGKAVKEANAEAFMNEQKKNSDSEKSSGVELLPDTSLSGYADAVEQARIINQITGVTVAPENKKAVQKAVDTLVKEGSYQDARKCKQAAVNIDYIFSQTRATKDKNKIYPIYMYVRGILGITLSGMTKFGKGEEDELKKLYKSIEKRYASMGAMSPSDKMKLLKDISNAYSKEWAWYSSLDENDAAAVHNSESRQGLEKDDKSGYRGMWANGTVNALDGLLDLSTAMLTINAYLSNQPWPSSDMADEENGITWKQLFEGLKEYFTTPTVESAKAEARRRASDSYIEDADSAGIGPQGETVPTEYDTEKENPWRKVADAAKAAGKSFASGKGLVDVAKDTANAARGN